MTVAFDAQGSTSLLLGTYTPKIDDKYRLSLPAKLRSQFASGLVMTRGQENCIYVIPINEFMGIYEKMKSSPWADKSSRDYLRIFLSGAVDQVPDKQGRISIPSILRDYAKLKRNVYIIGAGSRIEIWDETKWKEYVEENEQSYSDISEDVLKDL